MSVRIGLITTLNHNIGDDFIRIGLCKILGEVFKGKTIEFVAVNKHEPYTAYPRWHPVRMAAISKYAPRGKRAILDLIQSTLETPASSRFENCDAIVQCGAPVLWPNCHQAEWAKPLWHQIIGRLYERTPVLNLAAGSSYPWERPPSKVTDSDDAEFLQAIHRYCRLTTVRDTLSQALFQELGCQVQHIPCSALLAADAPQNRKEKAGVILINYMPGGGHFDFGQGIDAATWHETVRILVTRLRQRHEVAFLCHNEAEVTAASALAEGLPCRWPKSFAEYFTLVADAKAGIFNRMHASVALAGMGIPSVAIGTDTRLLMVKDLGLPCYYVKDTDPQRLEDEVERLLTSRGQEKERLLALREDTWHRYVDCVSNALS